MKAVVVDSKITDLFTSFDIEKEMLAKENIDLAVENVTSQSEYIEACRDADALLLIGTKTPKEVIDHLEKCKVIVRYGVGYDVVDIESCSAAGIVVCNVPDASITDVSGHAFTLALDCMRKVTYYDRQIRQGNWHSGCGYGLHRFSKYTFGFCGFGNIARATAEHVKALGCRMVAYDPYIRDEVFAAMGVERVSFDELLAQSDVISIHTPLSKETFHMFSKEQFEKMKPGVMLVNTSRGGVVDQEHLMDAIDAGIVTAAALDVNECEPLTDLNNRLFSYDTIILTPHCATESAEYFITLQTKAAQTAIDVLKGELPYNVLNRESILKYRNK